MDATAPPAPRRLGRGDRPARRSRLHAHLADTRIWLNGSFVTTKDEPADFDACRDAEGVDLDALDPVFFDFASGRANQKARFGGELLPNLIEACSGLAFADFFQNERDGCRKGIVVMLIGGSS